MDSRESVSDLLEYFKLDAEYTPDHTLQVSYAKKPGISRRKVRTEQRWYRDREIGHGSFGSVWLEVNQKGQGVTAQRAVKEVSKRLLRGSGIDYRRELLAMSTLSKFPREFVDFYGWFENRDSVFLTMEYFPYGDLSNYITAGFEEQEAKSITMQVLEGLKVMHKMDFTHRDLKPQNIFVVAKSPYWWVKIGDFGITKRVLGIQNTLRTQAGTPIYRAPEVVGFVNEGSDGYTNAVDMWSLGCVTYNMLAQRVPFATPGAVSHFCSKAIPFPVEPLQAKSVTNEAISFLENLIVPDPSRRLTVGEALQTSWLEDFEELHPPSEPDSEFEDVSHLGYSTDHTLEGRPKSDAKSHVQNSSTAVHDAAHGKSDVSTLLERAQQAKDSLCDGVVFPKDEDYFATACHRLYQSVRQWVVRFSKFSDLYSSHLTSEIGEARVGDRFGNAILDGSDVDIYLADRVKRRDVFMAVTMAMISELIFTRYLFGMDRKQRLRLKQLEKQLAEVLPTRTINQWRAVTLVALSKRPDFQAQRVADTEAVVGEIFGILAKVLPPPHNLEAQIRGSLQDVVKTAVDISIEMRTQTHEYIMRPPLQPDYDTNGDLVRKVYFDASSMSEASGKAISNAELETQNAVVRMVLFPLIIKKQDDCSDFLICRMQVLVSDLP